jgi:hypothetical protein
MDDSLQTRLEWMRLEFQDARRRHLVKTSELAATSGTNAETAPPAQAVLIHPAATEQPSDRPKAR